MAKSDYSYISDSVRGEVLDKTQYYQKARSWSAMVLGKALFNARKFKKGKGTKNQPKNPHTYHRGIHAGKTEYKLSTKGQNGVYFRASKNEMNEYAGTGYKIPIHGIFRAWGVGNGQPRVAGKRIYHGRKHIKRTTSNWLDDPIDKNAGKLADIAADYYGDKIIVNTFGAKIIKL